MGWRVGVHFLIIDIRGIYGIKSIFIRGIIIFCSNRTSGSTSDWLFPT